LSIELSSRLDLNQWRIVRVGDGQETSALAAARQRRLGRLLVVVDYAETRIGLAHFLRDVAADAGPVRVLLLARSVGEWWDRLAAGEPAVRDLLRDAGQGEPLAEEVSEKQSNVDLLLSAVPAFATALGVAVPSQVTVAMGSGIIRMLDLHAAALVAVLRSADAEGPVHVSVLDVLSELLGHEERFWQGTAERQGLLTEMTVATLRQIVAAGTLLGADSQDQAVELLGRVPGAVASVKVARWLRDLYPPEGGEPDGDGVEWLGSLRPARLAEQLVVAQLGASPRLAEECLSGLNERQALRAVTLLGRAAVDQQKAAEALLEHVIARLPADVSLLSAIFDAIPYPSTALAEADLSVTRRILPLLPSGNPGLRAHWLFWLSATLAQTGRAAEALPPARETVDMYRELAEDDPGQYREALAAALTDLGNRYLELGRPVETLNAEHEALSIRRELAAADPRRYRADLAGALNNLGTTLSELGRPAKALSPSKEAVDEFRALATADPDAYSADLAGALSNLSVRFAELGRRSEALDAEQEAVNVWRNVSPANPDRYQADLAVSLSNLGNRLLELDRPAEAVLPAQEAEKIRRQLAVAYPDRYRGDLAASLINLGVVYSAVSRSDEAVKPTQDEAVKPTQEEALKPTQEAVDIYRELAAANPDRYQANLGDALSNLGVRFFALGQPDKALKATQEAADIYRELAAANPDRYRAGLASALFDLGGRFWVLDQPDKALKATQEAADIYRELAAANPDRYQANLANAAYNLGNFLMRLDRPEEALKPTGEAVHVYRELAAANPGRYGQDLSNALKLLALAPDGPGLTTEAEKAQPDTGVKD
jgi:tetratricopeptide (TPR) repeat protein